MPRQSKTSGRRVRAALRTEVALKLRIEGKSFTDIASDMKITKQSVRELVVKALEDTKTQSVALAEDLRAIQNERLEIMHKALWPDVLAGDMRAAETVLKVMDRQARLNGLDAPAKIDQKNTGTLGVFAVPSKVEGDEWQASAQAYAQQSEARAQALADQLLLPPPPT